jgi:hypothetical protein
MPNIRPIDMHFLDDLLEMGSGYVLNFSDRTFTLFFADELDIDIDDSVSARNGGSKANAFDVSSKQSTNRPQCARSKRSGRYREALYERSRRPEKIENAQGRFLALVNRLQGAPTADAGKSVAPKPAFDRPKLVQLRTI